jgi:hypothetical protein
LAESPAGDEHATHSPLGFADWIEFVFVKKWPKPVSQKMDAKTIVFITLI